MQRLSIPFLQPRQDAPPSLAPSGVTPNFVNPDSIGYQVVGSSIALLVFTYLFVLIRLLVKWKVVKKWGIDDGLIIFALLLATGRAIVTTINAKYYGLGLHVWDINPVNIVVEGETQKNLLFIGDMLYLIGIMCTKLAILFLYLQLFRINRGFRYLCFATMGFVVVYCVVFFFIEVFNCDPVAKVWHELTYVGQYRCFDNSMVEMVIGGFNIGTDLFILILPIPLILNLQLDKKRKLGLLGIFATGIFVWVTTIVREVIVVQTLRDFDQSWATVPETVWLTIEFDVGIICACLPTFAPIWHQQVLKRLIPESLRSLLRSSRTSSEKETSQKASSKSFSKSFPKAQGYAKQTPSQSDIELVNNEGVNTRAYSTLDGDRTHARGGDWSDDANSGNRIMKQTEVDIQETPRV